MQADLPEGYKSNIPSVFWWFYVLQFSPCWYFLIFCIIAELVYNLSEQGKEFLDVSASEMLVQSFQLTRDLTNRQVVAIPCWLHSIPQLFITPWTVSTQVRSTNSMTLSFWTWSVMMQQSICLFRFVIPLLPICVLYAKAALAVGPL